MNFSFFLLATNIVVENDLDCRENFFRDEMFNFCVPICPDWSQDPPTFSVLHDVSIFLSFSIGFVAAIIIIVISVIRYKKM